MIEVQGLSKYYGSVRAVEGVSFTVQKAEVVGFLGPNGAGKTTTMQCITGYLEPTAGRILIDGYDVCEDPVSVKSLIGYLPENTPLYEDLTVYEFLDFVGSVRKVPDKNKAIKKAVEECALGDVINRTIGTLSKGYRQRVGLAQAILHEPPILILDEPTSGLDPLQIDEIRALIRQLGRERTIILSTHILPEVEQTCQRVLVINKGRLVADSDIETLKAQKAGTSVVVEYKGDVPPEAFQVFGNVTLLKEEDSLRRLRIAISQDTDPREEIFKMVKDKGAVLLELYRERKTLEEVFRALTENEPHSTH
ncbi:MAG: ATP-binding cassette domain-containing protein [Nitrospirae bacterium]|nr:MAG: ATP-binding cassette domain-containing protein [Nitrospirota bacterium]